MQKISETISQVLNPETSTQEPARTMASHSKSHSESVRSNVIQFDKCLEFLEKAGKEYISPKFQIWKEDHLIIFKLLVYFYQDKPNAEKHGIDLHKGILLTGPVGCGKTSDDPSTVYVGSQRAIHHQIPRDITLEFIRTAILLSTNTPKQPSSKQAES